MTENEPVFYTYAEAAAKLRVSVSWLKAHIKELPHTRPARQVLFSPDHIREIAKRFEKNAGVQVQPERVVDLIGLTPSRRARRSTRRSA